MDDFKQPGVNTDIPDRTWKGGWIEGSHNVPLRSPEEIGKEVAKIIKETPDIYAITVHTLLGVYVTTVVEDKDGRD